MRGRIGVTATDRVLLYVTGGFAALGMDFRQTFSEPPVHDPSGRNAAGRDVFQDQSWMDDWRWVEAGLWGNWSVKAEYLYAQFDGETVSGSFTGGVGVPRGATLANSLNDIHLQVARVGLNYRFVGP